MLACFEVQDVRPGPAAAAEAMTVPQRRPAGLWPWLLMAALQVVLGQQGLESERPVLRAIIKVTLLKHEPTGKPLTLEGVFVGGSAGKAEGKLMQVGCHQRVPALHDHSTVHLPQSSPGAQVAQHLCGTWCNNFP